MKRPFVVTVASEKGGVGKTTIATNLAVYLKALRDDIPVTIASFDNHFSVDQMFLLGPRPALTVADLLAGLPPATLVNLGEYGVQYIGSSRHLTPPSHAPGWLQRVLHSSGLDGILILDTRPILDWFTEAALLAASLVLVPVKDRAALTNANALHTILAAVERSQCLWLIPSLVDRRARLSADVQVHELLLFAAREMDYQVLDICISKSPKVESLASGFSSRIRPVLTHARNTAVHVEFKALAEFVLKQFERGFANLRDVHNGLMSFASRHPAGQRRYMVLECPICGYQSLSTLGNYFFDLRSRHRGFLHPVCLTQLLDDLNLESSINQADLIALTIDGPGLISPECRLTAHLCDERGGIISSEALSLKQQKSLLNCLAIITGRPLDRAYRELILINPASSLAEFQLTDGVSRSFAFRRRQVARQLRSAGLF